MCDFLPIQFRTFRYVAIDKYSIFLFFFLCVLAKQNCGETVELAKRMCNRMAYVGDIIGRDPDCLFTLPISELKQKIVAMNHSTRFWLAFKFIRRNVNDFESNASLVFPYSQMQICALLGINRSSLCKFICKFKDLLIVDLLPTYGYKSPIECNPKGREAYFKKIALNYADLLASNFFV